MYAGQYVFAQVMDFLPLHVFRRCVARYNGERRVKRFSCLDQYLCLAFAQLTWRESLRDIEACLRAQSSKLYHLGFRNAIARNTLANANAVRDWRIYADFAQHLIGIARRLYADDPLALELDETVYALESTTIDRCLSVFPWAPFRSTKADCIGIGVISMAAPARLLQRQLGMIPALPMQNQANGIAVGAGDDFLQDSA